MACTSTISNDASHAFRKARYGFEYLSAGFSLPRHQHCDAYATVLLHGSFEQCSYAGRMRINAGDVLIQPTLDFHTDRMFTPGVTLLRLPWPRNDGFGGVFSGCDTESLARLAYRDIIEAATALQEQIEATRPLPAQMDDVADVLAKELKNPFLSIGAWAEEAGWARESVSRSFARLYGVSASHFRAELRARAAWLRITGTREPLIAIANDCGFADQAHMTRAVRQLTGAVPTAWRPRSHSFKTGSERRKKLHI